MTSYRYDGSNTAEILGVLNESCHLVSSVTLLLVVSGMDGQQYVVPQTGYLVVDTDGWPVEGLNVADYEAKYSEISSV